MINEKYNGYSNYQTWSLASWLDNNEEHYNRYQSLYKELLGGGR